MSQGTKGKKRSLDQRLKDADTSLKKHTPKFYTGDAAVDFPIIDPRFVYLTTEEILKTTQALERGVVDTGAKKNDDGKLPIDLIPVQPLLDLAAVLQHGMIKYDANNWRKGFKFSRTYAAAMRHLLAWHSGEDFDPDSGLSHLSHATCNLFFLAEFMKTHPELDDRVK